MQRTRSPCDCSAFIQVGLMNWAARRAIDASLACLPEAGQCRAIIAEAAEMCTIETMAGIATSKSNFVSLLEGSLASHVSLAATCTITMALLYHARWIAWVWLTLVLVIVRCFRIAYHVPSLTRSNHCLPRTMPCHVTADGQWSDLVTRSSPQWVSWWQAFRGSIS